MFYITHTRELQWSIMCCGFHSLELVLWVSCVRYCKYADCVHIRILDALNNKFLSNLWCGLDICMVALTYLKLFRSVQFYLLCRTPSSCSFFL